MGHHALSKDGHRQKASQNRATLYQAAVEAWKKDSLSNSHAPALSKIVAQFPGINQTTLWHYIRVQTDSNCDETGCPLNVPLHEKVVVSAKSNQGCAVAKSILLFLNSFVPMELLNNL